MLTAFINGRFLTGDEALREAKVSAFDAGLTHGIGLFETLRAGRASGPWALHLDEHLDRLARSAFALGLASSLHTGPLGEAILETVQRSGLAQARVRLTLTGGDLNLLSQARATAAGSAPAGESSPTILIVAQPAAATPRAMLDDGVLVTLAHNRPTSAGDFESHKTLNYWWRLHELRSAGAKGAQEALVFSTAGHLVGGCVSNAFIVKDGELHTPVARGDEVHEKQVAAPAYAPPTLPGITRQSVMQAAAARGVLTQRRPLTIDDVLSADEVFLTSSVWGVLPVVRLEARGIGTGRVGPVTRELGAAYERELAELRALA